MSIEADAFAVILATAAVAAVVIAVSRLRMIARLSGSAATPRFRAEPGSR